MRKSSREARLHALALGSRFGRADFLLGAFMSLACGAGQRAPVLPGAAPVLPGAAPVSPGAALAPPVEPPEPGLPGCIESEPLQTYVRALGDARVRERMRALRALGATIEERPARFAEPGEASLLDQMSEQPGRQRVLVVAQVAGGAPSYVEVAKLGQSVRHR